MKLTRLATIAMILTALFGSGCRRASQEVERPEKIVSLRQVMYDSTTYAKLAQLWEKYYDAYPSEDAYANWMYAAFSANQGNAPPMIEKGVEKYPANPVLLYLSARSRNWGHDNLRARQLLEKAAALDPDYMDAWHALAVEYIVQGDRERADVALRRLLNGRAIEDVVMDFSYNMLATLDPNAILITNGDNDTFPGWILTRIIRFRPDVNIVNQSLLNVDSYQSSVVKEGVPEFITRAGLDSLMVEVSADRERYAKRQISAFEQASGFPDPRNEFMNLGDRLVVRIIEAAERTGRPVYFACTVNKYNLWEQRAPRAMYLGLVTLVTRSSVPYSERLRKLFRMWTSEYRTGGLDSWRLHSTGRNDAGRWLSSNYAAALQSLIRQADEAGPDVQLSLFRWYRTHLVDILDKNSVDKFNSMWFDRRFPPEIREWSKSKGWLGD
jgi:tetratricopeptide (TPR) repeat protein